MNHDEHVGLVAEAAAAFVGVVVTIEPDGWDRPGLGEWSVRELVGHTLRAFATVDRFLDLPLEEVRVDDAAEYFRLALSIPGIHRQVAQRGRDAGSDLGDDPVTAVVERVGASLGRLAATTGEEIGTTAVGGMRLGAYLDTRLVELVAHLSDLCAALDVAPPDSGAAGIRAASVVYASAPPAARDAVLRAMLGRSELPPGFTVWP